MSTPSRIELARRKVKAARYAIAILGTAAFAGTAVIAKAMHPGHAARARARTVQAIIPDEPAAFANAAASAGESVPLQPAPVAQAPVVQSSGS